MMLQTWVDDGLAWWGALGGDWQFLLLLPFAVAALGLLRLLVSPTGNRREERPREMH